jgi:hypothetical protein
MEDHWAAQPGVDPDRAQLMWFMRFGHDPRVTGLARVAQDKLAGLDGLDLVPAEWLHMTTLITGYADEITDRQVQVMTGRARELLAATPPVAVTLAGSCTTPARSCSTRHRTTRCSPCSPPARKRL